MRVKRSSFYADVMPPPTAMLHRAEIRSIMRTIQEHGRCGVGMVFFTFPDDVRWNAECEAVEFGVTIGEYSGVVRISRRAFQRLLAERPTPERCFEAYYLQRTRFEGIAERKIRQRQLTEDGNVEITGRDLREGTAATPRRTLRWR
jgi:hypothetical protein